MSYKLEDVAKLAGVSKTTVSRVLNNRGYLSQKTIDNVYQAMSQLNYQPNAAAQQLQKKKTHIIGLLFPAIAHPFFGEIVELLEKKLYLKGYTVIVGDSMYDEKKEEHYLRQLLSHQVDGLIVGTHNFNIQTYNKYSGLPIVSVERILNDEIPTISVDNYHGGVLATQYLIDQGAKHIVHTSGHTYPNMPSSLRHQGYIDTIKKHHFTPHHWEVEFELSHGEKDIIFSRLLDEHPNVDGIFAGNDVEAAQILSLIQRKYTNANNQPLVIGFDGTNLIRTVLPNMPTIVQPINDLADTAVTVLENRMMNVPTQSTYMLDVTLYEGINQS